MDGFDMDGQEDEMGIPEGEMPVAGFFVMNSSPGELIH